VLNHLAQIMLAVSKASTKEFVCRKWHVQMQKEWLQVEVQMFFK
jgi:hypothetical protein